MQQCTHISLSTHTSKDSNQFDVFIWTQYNEYLSDLKISTALIDKASPELTTQSIKCMTLNMLSIPKILFNHIRDTIILTISLIISYLIVHFL